MALVCWAIGRVGAAIGAYHSLRMGEDTLEVVLAHREADHADVSLAALQERDRERVRFELLSLRETSETLAVGGRIGVVGHTADLDVVPSTDELDLGDRLASDLLGRRG